MDSAGNPRGLWLLVEGIHVELWVVSEMRIHAEIQGNFQIGVEMRGKFPKTCKYFYSSKNDIKSYVIILHFEILRETRGNFPRGPVVWSLMEFLGLRLSNKHRRITLKKCLLSTSFCMHKLHLRHTKHRLHNTASVNKTREGNSKNHSFRLINRHRLLCSTNFS